MEFLMQVAGFLAGLGVICVLLTVVFTILVNSYADLTRRR